VYVTAHNSPQGAQLAKGYLPTAHKGLNWLKIEVKTAIAHLPTRWIKVVSLQL